jgi:hypothetical protein
MRAQRRMDQGERQHVSVTDRGVRGRLPVTELSAARFKWRSEQPSLHVRAMVLADATLWIAGPPDLADEEEVFRDPYDAEVRAKLDEQAAALDGQRGALLWAVSATDGKRLAEYQIDSPPTWDGMAAAAGRLYVSTQAGTIVCFGDSR